MISGSLSPQHGASSGSGWRNDFQYGGYLWIYWISSRGQPTRSGRPAWRLDEVLTIPHRKTGLDTKGIHEPRTWTESLIRTKKWNRDMKFGTWNDGSPYRSGTLSTISRELAKYKLSLVCVQEVRWEKESTVRAGKYFFCIEKETINFNRKAEFLHHRILSAVKSRAC
jgi:hypothetical protein